MKSCSTTLTRIRNQANLQKIENLAIGDLVTAKPANRIASHLRSPHTIHTRWNACNSHVIRSIESLQTRRKEFHKPHQPSARASKQRNRPIRKRALGGFPAFAGRTQNSNRLAPAQVHRDKRGTPLTKVNSLFRKDLDHPPDLQS